MTDPSVPHGEASETSLSSGVLERAKNGDQQAFKRITSLYGRLVYHWCRKSGLSPEDSEDVGQKVFMSVSKGLANFRRENPGDSFRGWLRVVSRSRIADHYREISNREQAIGGTSHLDRIQQDYLAEEATTEELRQDRVIIYERAIQLLQGEFAQQDSKAFHMVVVDGLSPREAANALGITVNSVYIAKSRILKRLRDEFEELLEDDTVKDS